MQQQSFNAGKMLLKGIIDVEFMTLWRLGANFHHGLSSLTEPSIFASTIERDEKVAENERLRQQTLKATERAK